MPPPPPGAGGDGRWPHDGFKGPEDERPAVEYDDSQAARRAEAWEGAAFSAGGGMSEEDQMMKDLKARKAAAMARAKAAMDVGSVSLLLATSFDSIYIEQLFESINEGLQCGGDVEGIIRQALDGGRAHSGRCQSFGSEGLGEQLQGSPEGCQERCQGGEEGCQKGTQDGEEGEKGEKGQDREEGQARGRGGRPRGQQ